MFYGPMFGLEVLQVQLFEMSYLTLSKPQANDLISLAYFGSHSSNQKPTFSLPGVLAAPFINNAISAEFDVLT